MSRKACSKKEADSQIEQLRRDRGVCDQGQQNPTLVSSLDAALEMYEP